jgi:phenylalanyl-tRNA synthetase beta chain
MKISLRWLNEFVNIEDYFSKPAALGEILTRAGLEVEEIQDRARDFEHVVVGLILEKGKHPQADRLSLCQVTTGEGVVHQIVCGAQNHKANDRVVVALPGAVLPGNFAIKKAVVRGVESGGMLCSFKELGLAAESEGIVILPELAPIGEAFAKYQGLDDITFELKVTANRADCLSHYGLAREVACLLGRELKKVQPDLSSARGKTSEFFQLKVEDAELCPRYTGRFIKNVKVGESPAWLKKRLELIGMKSINNIVDITNYVMMELGQPLHAFDAAQIDSRQVIVGRSRKDEKFVTLGATELSLTGEELMIKDPQRSLCIGGVIGGLNSGVTEPTTEIFLESAYFSPLTVRRALRGHGLNTDSGYRFSRGVDPEGALVALDRATELILKVAGGEAFAEPLDFYPTPHKKQKISIDAQWITDRLGYPADAKKFSGYMVRLGCKVEEKGSGESTLGAWEILPPSFRFDLEQPVDLVEEYARLDGYENIPESLPTLDMMPTQQDLNYMQQTETSRLLRAQGFSEALHSIFVGSRAQSLFIKDPSTLREAGLSLSSEPVKVLNPLNEEQDVLRQTLAFGLLNNLKVNFHSGNAVGRLFEMGKVFLKEEGSAPFLEKWRLGFSAWGSVQGLWQKKSDHHPVFEVKAAVENYLKALGLQSFKWQTISNKGEVPAFLHRGQVALLVLEGKKIGFIGSLHPEILEEEKIRTDAALAEVDLEAIFQKLPRPKKAQTPSRFPAMERDLALLMPKTMKAQQVMESIRKSAGPLLVDLEVFDVFEGQNLEPGQKSVAFRMTFQDRKDTLREEVVSQSLEAIQKELREKLNVAVR